MTPDQAAALLQIPERGIELLQRYQEEDNIAKAIQAVQGGFTPSDVAQLYSLPYEASEEEPEAQEGDIKVYECKTARCRQKNRVSTASGDVVPTCPSCQQDMYFVMTVADAEEISHMRRTYVPAGRIADPLARTDKHRDGSPWEDVDD